jgi:D-arabinose 5-phosphate isomerase GutQ
MRSTDVLWRDALACIAVDGQHISTQEVSDFCSLLFLADHIHIVGPGRNEPAATMLAAQLTTLGYSVHGVEQLRTVEASDTVVIVNGPAPHQQSVLDPLLRSATETGAVLLAIAAEDCSALLTLADAAITIPLPKPRGRTDGSLLGCTAFDLLAALTVAIVGRDLAGRLSPDTYPAPPVMTSHTQPPAVPAAPTDDDFQTRTLTACSRNAE